MTITRLVFINLSIVLFLVFHFEMIFHNIHVYVNSEQHMNLIVQKMEYRLDELEYQLILKEVY